MATWNDKFFILILTSNFQIPVTVSSTWFCYNRSCLFKFLSSTSNQFGFARTQYFTQGSFVCWIGKSNWKQHFNNSHLSSVIMFFNYQWHLVLHFFADVTPNLISGIIIFTSFFEVWLAWFSFPSLFPSYLVSARHYSNLRQIHISSDFKNQMIY
jgi:hypothetical protein